MWLWTGLWMKSEVGITDGRREERDRDMQGLEKK